MLYDDIAGQHKSNDLYIRLITIARAKLLEQQVNSLLTEYNLFINENFILSKSLHACMIRFVAEASMSHGDELYVDNRSSHHQCVHERGRKARAPLLKKKI
jgi:hypothetical protein